MEDAETRYRVMLEVIRKPRSPSREAAGLWMRGFSSLSSTCLPPASAELNIRVWISRQSSSNSRARSFRITSIFAPTSWRSRNAVPSCDYIVMNGVFTEKRGLTFDEMLAYFERTLSAVFAKAKMGIAFNVMSKHVDWERDDLFHLPFDTLARFLITSLTRNFVIRNDYGLYEYTTYVYR